MLASLAVQRSALIFSARMGAGHDGAAKELARRLVERGHEATVVDFLDAFARPLSSSWKWFYEFQLRRFPESYESSYQLFYKHPNLWKPFVGFERALAGHRTMRWVEQAQPDVIVSTYSFATLVIGKLKAEGRISVPAVNFLTDFGVHPRAVHPAIELNLAVHPVAADAARRFVTTPVIATGPAVSPAFGKLGPTRAEARAALGLASDQPVVLVVAGSWGIGPALAATVGALVGTGRYHVITVCGRDEQLKRRLDDAALGEVIGWTDQMPTLIAAADVVVENAGGLTSLEAFASGVPIVSYRAIPGHGRDNVATMVRAGVTSAPADDAGLVAAVDRLLTDEGARRRQIEAANAMFVEDPADRILDVAAGIPVEPEQRVRL